MTSNSKTEGRFGKQDFCYVAEKDIYVCPALVPVEAPSIPSNTDIGMTS
jgi:hypothetical protein